MIPELRLTDSEKASLQLLAERTMPQYRPEMAGPFIGAAKQALPYLDSRIHQWAAAAQRANAGLLLNVPIGSDVPRTPTRKGVVDAAPMFSDGVIGLLSALFGTMYVFDTKNVQRQIHNVYPSIEDENTQLGASSDELEWHVEDGFHIHRPSWVGLLCLRGDPAVVTRVAVAEQLGISSRDKELLQQDECRLKIDESFSQGIRERQYVTKVLQQNSGHVEIVFDPEYTIYRDENQRALHRRVTRAANVAKSDVTLRAGEFLILNNRRTIHSRTGYIPRRDGTDRWVKRTLIVDEDRVDVVWLSPGVARTNLTSSTPT